MQREPAPFRHLRSRHGRRRNDGWRLRRSGRGDRSCSGGLFRHRGTYGRCGFRRESGLDLGWLDGRLPGLGRLDNGGRGSAPADYQRSGLIRDWQM